MRFATRKKQKIPSVMLWAAAAFCGILFFLYFAETQLKPTLLAISQARGTMLATQSIQQVIQAKVGSKENAQAMLDIKLDHQGRVAFIQPNTSEFNKLSADTVIGVQEKLNELAKEKITIPLGQVLGSSFLASLGPPVTVKVIPIGTVQVSVVNKFESAGINQTKHMVYLMVTVTVKIVVPLVTQSVVVDTQVPIAEYVVVGEVPNTYLQIPLHE